MWVEGDGYFMGGHTKPMQLVLFSKTARTPAARLALNVLQALRATICSARFQGHRANSLRSNMRGSVGLLRSPQTLNPPRFEAATHSLQPRCGGSGLVLAIAFAVY